MTTRSKQATKQVEAEESAQEGTPAPALQIVTSDPDTSNSLFDKLIAQFDTSHMPDTHEMEIQAGLLAGTKLPYKLMKSADSIQRMRTRTAVLLRLLETPARVEAELPELFPLLPIDALLLFDAVTVQDSLLPPFDFSLAQCVKLGQTGGSLLSDIANEIRLMSQPAMWPKPAPTPAHPPETSGMVNPAQETEDAPHEAQDAQKAA